MTKAKKKQNPDTPNTRAASAPSNRAAGLRLMRAGCCVPRAIVCWPEIFVIRWARLTLLCGAGVSWFLSRSNFAPIVMRALMPCRRPSGGASARALPDLSHAIRIMRALSGGLTCLSSAAPGASATIKIFGALEPTRDFGESVGRDARNAQKRV